MAEQTKRGEEDRKREGEEMQGEPVKVGNDTPAATVTRDKGVAPSQDSRREGRGEGTNPPPRGQAV